MIRNLTKCFIVTVTIFACTAATCPANETGSGTQESKEKSATKKRPVNPVMTAIKDSPALPRVLLIGDSISIGYTLGVRELLKDKANVHRPLTNCGPTTRGLEQIEQWLGKKPWDVIHFNWGLHDLKYISQGTMKLVDVNAPGSQQQVPIEQYEANLRKLVATLKQTNATLIWRSTTPVPKGAKGRVPGDSAKYNAIAAGIMKENDIETDDMYAYTEPRLKELQLPANVHFTKAGSQSLAEQVAKTVSSSLDPRSGLRTTIDEAIRLLEAKDYLAMIREFANPKDLKKILENKSLETVAARFGIRKADELLRILKLARGVEPQFDESGTRATFSIKTDLDQQAGGKDKIAFEKVERRWYIHN